MPDAAGNKSLNLAEMRKQIRAIGVEITPENLGGAQREALQAHHPAEPYPGVKPPP